MEQVITYIYNIIGYKYINILNIKYKYYNINILITHSTFADNPDPPLVPRTAPKNTTTVNVTCSKDKKSGFTFCVTGERNYESEDGDREVKGRKGEA